MTSSILAVVLVLARERRESKALAGQMHKKMRTDLTLMSTHKLTQLPGK
jgi:hypothetical protein